MLAKANRITRPNDFRSAVRRGRRYTATTCVVHVLSTSNSEVARFGFIVSKAVGNAVTRNKVRRRMRAVALELLPRVDPGSDIVVRALAGSARAEWVILQSDIKEGIDHIVVKA